MNIITGSENDLAKKAAKHIALILEQGKKVHEHSNIMLSGGKSPVGLYHEIAKLNIDWKRVNLFLGDERHVPQNDERSNQGMINRELISRINIPEENIYFPSTDRDLNICADEYNFILKSHFDNWGAFDLAIIGVGTDGHIMSIFPDGPLMEKDNHFFLPIEGKIPRISGTIELIKRVKCLIIYAPSADKREIINMALEHHPSTENLPVGWIARNCDDSFWYISD